MNCAVKNKSISRKKSAEYGKKEAANRISLFLDYALADKCGYSQKMISNIHATLDRYIDDVYEGKISPATLQRELSEDYGAIIELGKNRQKPRGKDVNLVEFTRLWISLMLFCSMCLLLNIRWAVIRSIK